MNEYQIACAQPFRPAKIGNKGLVVQVFDKKGRMTAEIPFVYQRFAEECVSNSVKHGSTAKIIRLGEKA